MKREQLIDVYHPRYESKTTEALRAILPDPDYRTWRDEPQMAHDLLAEAQAYIDRLRYDLDAEIGPRISLDGVASVSLGPQIIEVDFDADKEPRTDLYLPELWEFNGSAFQRAARIYQRECGWDFAPGEAGVWIMNVMLTDFFGGKETGSYGGHVMGFAILHDRDDDDRIESLAHIWTARNLRRRSIASEIMGYAKFRYPITVAEQPTESGSALLKGFDL